MQWGKKSYPKKLIFQYESAPLHFKSPLIYFRWFPLVFNSNVDDVNDLTSDAKISFAENSFNYEEAQNLWLTAPGEEHKPLGTKSEEHGLWSVSLFQKAMQLGFPLLGNECPGIALPIFTTRVWVFNLSGQNAQVTIGKEWMDSLWIMTYGLLLAVLGLLELFSSSDPRIYSELTQISPLPQLVL